MISRRSRIAAAMRKMPVTMDHALAIIKSAKAAAQGHEERENAHRDAGEAFQRERPPPLVPLGRPETGDDREDSVHQGIRPEQQDERTQREAGIHEGEDAEHDGQHAPQHQRPPVSSQHHVHSRSPRLGFSAGGMIGGFPRPRKTTAGAGRPCRARRARLSSFDALSHPLRRRGHGGTIAWRDAMIHEYRGERVVNKIWRPTSFSPIQ